MRTSNNILNSNMILYTDAIMQKSDGVKQDSLTLLRKIPWNPVFLGRDSIAFLLRTLFSKLQKRFPLGIFLPIQKTIIYPHVQRCSVLICILLGESSVAAVQPCLVKSPRSSYLVQWILVDPVSRITFGRRIWYSTWQQNTYIWSKDLIFNLATPKDPPPNPHIWF